MAQRSKDLRKLAGILKDLAVQWNVAVAVVNQVTDNFKRPSSQAPSATPEEDLLSSDYQAKWFYGLIDEFGEEGTKKPALGLVWSNLITSRIMLGRDRDGRTRINVVFSPFASRGRLLYGISSELGIHAITPVEWAGSDETKLIPDTEVHGDGVLDVGVQDIRSDFDFNINDVEFSDFDVEDLLSGQLNE